MGRQTGEEVDQPFQRRRHEFAFEGESHGGDTRSFLETKSGHKLFTLVQQRAVSVSLHLRTRFCGNKTKGFRAIDLTLTATTLVERLRCEKSFNLEYCERLLSVQISPIHSHNEIKSNKFYIET